jgi:hypothetical protein
MDRYFPGSRRPLEEPLRRLGAYLLEHTEHSDVLAGDERVSRWAAALSGRRALLGVGIPAPEDQRRRFDVLATLLDSSDPEAVASAATEYGVTHLLVTPKLLERYASTLEELDSRPHLRRVLSLELAPGVPLRLYRIEPPP